MTDSLPSEQDVVVVQCVQCDHDIRAPRKYFDLGHSFLCAECEAKTNEAFWEALHQENPPVRREDIV